MVVHRDDHFDGAQVDLRVPHVESWSPPGSAVVADVLHLPVDEAHVPLVVLVPGDLVRPGGSYRLFSFELFRKSFELDIVVVRLVNVVHLAHPLGQFALIEDNLLLDQIINHMSKTDLHGVQDPALLVLHLGRALGPLRQLRGTRPLHCAGQLKNTIC